MVWRRKVRLYIRVRKQGARVESLPLKAVEEMACKCHRSWYLEDGWLVLVSN